MFTPNSFVDGSAGNTPITAATLNNLELGLVAADITNPASAATVALAAVSTRTRLANSIVWIGDSITAYNGGVSISTPLQWTTAPTYDSKGMAAWANVFLNHDLNVLGNAGIGGQTSDQILARWATDVTAYHPAFVLILAGTNDTLTVNTIANLKTMMTLAAADQTIVVVCTIIPSTGTTVDREAQRMYINSWIRDYARKVPGVIVADLAAVFQDPTITGFKPNTTYVVADGTHPSLTGGIAGGREIAAVMRQFVPRNRARAAVSVAPYNCLANSGFSGTGTADPASWSANGTGITKSFVPRTDGYAGQSFQIVVPAASSFYMTSNVNVGANECLIGDTVEFTVTLEVQGQETSSANQKFINAQIQQYDGSGFGDRAYDLYADGSYGNGQTLPNGEYVLQPPPRVVMATRIIVQVLVGGTGGGTYLVRSPALRNLTLLRSERSLFDAAMTAGIATLTSATATFTSADVGKAIRVLGAGVSSAPLVTTIAALVNSTTVTLAATSSTTVSVISAFINPGVNL